MLRVGAGAYEIQGSVGELPDLYNDIIARVRLHDDFAVQGSEGRPVFIAVRKDGAGWPFLAVSLRCEVGFGFYPGVFLVPEHDLLLVGAKERLLAYDLTGPSRLWEDHTLCGFWSWDRHGDIVVMSAELEVAGYSLRGERLWSRGVEPPWSYAVTDDVLRLDVMGAISEISLRTGD
jgi:hypothetical protein